MICTDNKAFTLFPALLSCILAVYYRKMPDKSREFLLFLEIFQASGFFRRNSYGQNVKTLGTKLTVADGCFYGENSLIASSEVQNEYRMINAKRGLLLDMEVR